MSADRTDGPPPKDGVIEARFEGRRGDFRLDAAFTVPAFGVTALTGPSGGGKTSLLRCIAGLERMDGRLRIGDQVWQDERRFLPPHQRAVGYVFQEPSLLPHLSVRANLWFGLTRARTPPQIGFDEVVALLGVEPLLARSPARLSGGEQQRVAIGRALLSQPQWLLMDEPLSGLDPAGKIEILPYLERLHQTLAIPVLYVSHDPAEIARLADRVLLMREGRVTALPAVLPLGTPQLERARLALSAMDAAQVTGLALAALMAGLGATEDGDVCGDDAGLARGRPRSDTLKGG